MLKKQENGRSMIEMLGVLAIIGVLSVGGIYGYTTAMRSHKANEIINGASMLYMLGIAQNGGSGDAQMLYSTHFGSNAVPDGASEITYNANKSMTLAITNVDICYQVKNKLGDKVTAGDCSTSPYSLTVAFGEVVSPDGKPCTSDPECGTGYGCHTEVGETTSYCREKPTCVGADQINIWHVQGVSCCSGLIYFYMEDGTAHTKCISCIPKGGSLSDYFKPNGDLTDSNSYCCPGLTTSSFSDVCAEPVTCVDGGPTSDPTACCPGFSYVPEFGECMPS